MADNNRKRVQSTALIGIVAALYVTMTLLFAPFAYGPVQLRMSEGLNHLAVFNRRYIWALTLGVLIANLFSPLGIVDVIFGTLGTLIMTSISAFLTRHVTSIVKRLVISTVVDTIMMWSVALELFFVAHAPFWVTYGWVAIGECLSLIVGAVLIYLLHKRIDLGR
ncbi:QueT transporter family protein [Weissella diestrammenae]|uniref:QueT transporter family protein n=1 Tax=Weissella diestrammenae TaxID=1162633 RepID=A0A7G9T3V1_9LACO|nr:QueT transporter family protein [Weissella diestrammenae]MCM0582764.1 QueT transporter family protein [Weissella diestrammenae]QNN74776.1 QueT transporter family protein [Weissella diestrammenae]